MKVGEFDIMITDSVDRDDLSAEISKDHFELGSLYIDDGKAIIEIGPNRKNVSGVWTIEYKTFKQIVNALDDFLESIGYPTTIQEDEDV